MVEFEKHKTVTVVDFEIASSKYYSACALGIVLIEESKIVDEQYYLIQPPENYYEKDSIDIHGITPDQTVSAASFPAVWNKVKQYFSNTFVAAHNANFDMSVLKATLDYYGISQPDFIYVDTIAISGKFMKTGEKNEKSLESRCSYLGIPLDAHHNALCDAKAAASIILYAIEHSRYKTIGTFVVMRGISYKQYEEVSLKSIFKPGGFPKRASASEVAATTTIGEIDLDFRDKVFVFTGELKRYTREEAMAKVIAGGGQAADSISRKVDILVNADTRVSGKVKDALKLQEKGHHIKIITDEQFMAMLADSGAVNLD